jgi:hypothetical protein
VSSRPPNLPPWNPANVPDRPPFPTGDEPSARRSAPPSREVRPPFPEEGEVGWVPDDTRPISEAPPPSWSAFSGDGERAPTGGPGSARPSAGPAPQRPPTSVGASPPSASWRAPDQSSAAPPGTLGPDEEEVEIITKGAGPPKRRIIRRAQQAKPPPPAPGVETLTEQQMYKVIVQLAARSPAARRLMHEIQAELQSLLELDRSRRF